MEVGLSTVRFPDAGETVTGPTARVTFDRESPRAFTSASAAGLASGNGATGSLDLITGGRTRLARALLGELSSELSFVTSSTSRAAGTALVQARMLRPFGHGGAWISASGDVSKREAGGLWGRGVAGGTWWSWPRAQLSASIIQEWTAGQLFDGDSRGLLLGVVPVRYTEGAFAVRVDRDVASLRLGGELRRDRDAESLYDAGLYASLTFWQTATRSISLTVTRQLPDFIRGADAARSVTLAVRLNEPSPAAARAERIRPIIQVSESDTATRQLRVRAAGARRVEIMGDFTGWEPMELASAGDVFSREVVLAPGTHRVVLRLDGGAWRLAANTPAVNDDFGGRVGLLVVP